MLMLFPYFFLLLLPLCVFLVVYETGKAIAAIKKGAKQSFVIKEFVIAAVMGVILLMVLFIWGKYFHWILL